MPRAGCISRPGTSATTTAPDLREADSAGMDFFAFKVADKATLEKLDGDLKAYGLSTERIPGG
jgi:hypothetical protein